MIGEWHAVIDKDGVKRERVHQIFDNFNAAVRWANEIVEFLGGRPAVFTPETCPLCRERKLSAVRASHL